MKCVLNIVAMWSPATLSFPWAIVLIHVARARDAGREEGRREISEVPLRTLYTVSEDTS